MINAILLSILVWTAGAQEPLPAHERIWDTKNQIWLSVEHLPTTIAPGDTLVLGEIHGFPGDEEDPVNLQHHSNQTRLLQSLSQRVLAEGRKLNVGMEFLFYTHQSIADRWLADELDDDQFINESDWGSSPLFFYRSQMREPIVSGGRLLALNIPRSVSSTVARHGPQGLSEEQMKLLPPIWERGVDPYFERIKEHLSDHGPGIDLEKYFMAMSLWDDTMAWNSTRAPLGQDNLVIVVGETHVLYGHGLPARLQRYGAPQVKTMVQRHVETWTDESLQSVIAPHSKYGETADFIWVFSTSKP